jgi:hypothetical protein
VAGLDEVDLVITDDRAPADQIEALRSAGLEVRIVATTSDAADQAAAVRRRLD